MEGAKHRAGRFVRITHQLPTTVVTQSFTLPPTQAGLLTLASLSGLSHLRDLYLVGNPCTEWEGYRAYVVATLPQVMMRHSRYCAEHVMLTLALDSTTLLRWGAASLLTTAVVVRLTFDTDGHHCLQLARLDGKDIKPSERIAAQQALPELTRRLRWGGGQGGAELLHMCMGDTLSVLFSIQGGVACFWH